MLGRNYASSGSRVDGTDGAQCDDGRFWFSDQPQVLLHDRDSKYCSSFGQVIEAGSVKILALPPRSPNLNAYAERWVRSVKEECLAKLSCWVRAHCSARCATTKPTIMKREITKAKTTYCYSLCRLKQSMENRKRCVSGAAGRPAEIL
jgi:transposase InsO family protein